MKVKRPLVNPTAKDIHEYVSEETPNSATSETQNTKRGARKPKSDQLDFRINKRSENFKQLFSSFRFLSLRRLDVLEASPFWKNLAIPMLVVSNFVIIFLLLVGGIFVFDSISPTLQLFYDPVEQTWFTNQGIDKSFIFIIGIFIIGLFLLEFRLVKYVFKTDRRLALTLSWIISYLNILFIIAIGQIYSLN